MMWDEVVKQLADFSTAVLTVTDSDGYPFSIRCQPAVDHSAQVLRLPLPSYANLQTGPAGLLCHKHDEALWNLKSFVVRGSLEQDGQGWLFRPQQFIPGAGMGGLMGFIQFLREGRRGAKQYLDKRGLPRPPIPWGQIKAIWTEIKRTK